MQCMLHFTCEQAPCNLVHPRHLLSCREGYILNDIFKGPKIKEMDKGLAMLFASEKYFCNFLYLTFGFRLSRLGIIELNFILLSLLYPLVGTYKIII